MVTWHQITSSFVVRTDCIHTKLHCCSLYLQSRFVALKNKYWHRLYIEIDLRNSLIQKHTLWELLFFMFKIRARMQFSLNIQTIATVTFILYNSSTKKVILSVMLKLNVAYILNTILSIIVCYILQRNNNSSNEIRDRTGVRLQATAVFR